MAVPVYSVKFFELQGLLGFVSYTVPPGYVAVVRDLDAYASAGAAAQNLYLIGNVLQTIWWHNWTGLSIATAQWRGRQVFVAGEQFHLNSDAGVDVTVSGYLLSTP